MTAAELRQITAELARKAADPTYQKSPEYSDAIGRLSAWTENAFTPGEEGKLPVFDSAALTTVIGTLAESCAAQNGADANDRNNLDSLVNLFSQLDTARGMTLPEAVNALEIRNVKILSEPGRAGANSSSRSMIAARDANGKTTDGYFTDEDRLFRFDADGKAERFLRGVMEKFPEDPELQTFCGRVLNSPAGVDSLLSSIRYRTLRSPIAAERAHLNQVVDPDRMVRLGLVTRDDYRSIFANPRIKYLVDSLGSAVKGDEAERRATRIVQYGTCPIGVKAEYGSSVPGRNVAMSRMANLLGMPEIVARTVPMKVQTEKGLRTGVFMEKAKGAGIPDPKRGVNPHRSDLTDIDHESFDGPILRELSNLEILDYVCMNVDRHLGNIMYDFDDQSGKVVGVMGIDNDLSFGTRVVRPNETLQNGTRLDDINVISESAAAAINRLTPDVIRAALSDTGLTDNEISATCSRVETLKQRIVSTDSLGLRRGEKKREGTLRIVPDAEWEKLRVGQLAVDIPIPPQSNGSRPRKRRNIFGRVRDVPMLVGHLKGAVDPRAGDKPEPEFGAAGQFVETSFEGRTESHAKFAAISAKLKGTVSWVHGATENFTKLTDALDEFLASPVKPDREMSDADHYAYRERLDALAKAAKEYIGYKLASKDHGRTGMKRLHYAQDLLNYTEKHGEAYMGTFFEQKEREMSDDFFAARDQESKVERIAEAISARIEAEEPGSKHEQICRAVKYGDTLRTMLNADDEALDRFADLATFDPDRLYVEYKKEAVSVHQAGQAQESAPDRPVAPQEPVVNAPAAGNGQPEAADDSVRTV